MLEGIDPRPHVLKMLPDIYVPKFGHLTCEFSLIPVNLFL